MKHRLANIAISVAGLVVLAGAVLAVNSAWNPKPATKTIERSSPTPGSTSSLAPVTTPTPAASFSATDKAFLITMVAHHQAAINAASLAPQNATSQVIQQLAARMVKQQQAELDQMTSWYQAAYHDPVPNPDTDPHAGHGGESGATTYEQAFAVLMVPHETKGQDLAGAILTQTGDSRIQQLAQAIIARTPAEVAALKPYLP